MEENFLSSAETWVAAAFVIFLGLLVYLKVPGKLASVLDDRAAKIKAELDAAAALHAEAQATVARYREMAGNAGKETQRMVDDARTVAQANAAKIKADVDALLARRVLQGKEKIARAETDAVAQVRNAATDTAIAAARGLIAQRLDAGTRAALFDQSLAGIEILKPN